MLWGFGWCGIFCRYRAHISSHIKLSPHAKQPENVTQTVPVELSNGHQPPHLCECVSVW